MDLIELSIGLDRVRMPWYLQQMLKMCQNGIFLDHKSKKSHFLRKKSVNTPLPVLGESCKNAYRSRSLECCFPWYFFTLQGVSSAR